MVIFEHQHKRSMMGRPGSVCLEKVALASAYIRTCEDECILHGLREILSASSMSDRAGLEDRR